jgi:undecaprenyl-diphosphatase
VIEVLAALPPWVVLLVACAVVAAEPAVLAGVVLPSVASVVLTGFVAGLGVVPLVVAVVLVAAAAAGGDALAFAAGRRRAGSPAGPAPPRRAGLQQAWDRAAALYVRVGRPAVALARWVTVARTVVPRLAGTSGLSWPRYLALAVPSAVVWSTALTGAGYAVGASYAEVSRYVGRGGGALVVVALAGAAVVAAGHWIGRHPDVVRATAGRLAGARAVRVLGRHHPGGVPQRLAVRAAAAGLLTGALLVLALALYGTLALALAWSGLRGGDDWLAGQLAGLRGDRLTAGAWLVVGTLRSTWVLLALAVVAALTCRRQHARGRAPDLSDRTSALAVALLPLVALALAGALTDVVSPEPSDPAVRDWVLGAQVPVVTAAAVTLAGLLTAGRPWVARAAGVTGAELLALLLVVSRVYLGWDTPTSALTSLLIGTAWAGLLLVAWREAVSRGAALPPSPGGVRAPA